MTAKARRAIWKSSSNVFNNLRANRRFRGIGLQLAFLYCGTKGNVRTELVPWAHLSAIGAPPFFGNENTFAHSEGAKVFSGGWSGRAGSWGDGTPRCIMA